LGFVPAAQDTLEDLPDVPREALVSFCCRMDMIVLVEFGHACDALE
jgi:hypothetical protein